MAVSVGQLGSLILAVCGLGLSGLAAAEPAPAEDPAALKFFEEQVRPLLVDKCLKCHGADKQHGDLRLDLREQAFAGGAGGPAIIPGQLEDSLLILAVKREGGLEMPPDQPLTPEQVRILETWVSKGAAWPADTKKAVTPTSVESMLALKQSHWSLRPVTNPPLPTVKQADWPLRNTDRFILETLEQHALTPSPQADPRTLLRRLTFALTGLPPTFEELEAFAADPSEAAYQAAVERLLASPHYGERWARMWLDVARYADNKGYVFFEDGNFPWSYTYRDYVIEAFNADVPYDQFVKEQLAADKLPLGENKRPLRGLGFITVGGRFLNNPHDIVDDRIDVVTRGLLGLTVSCARCHDHKFDPLPTADYYALYGVFASSQEPLVPALYDPPPATEEYQKFATELAAREQKLRDFVVTKQNEVIQGAKTRAGEYLLTAFQTRDQPRTDDFMIIADGGDVNPKILLRWQLFLERMSKQPDGVWRPWAALTALPQENWAAQTTPLLTELAANQNPDQPSNPVVLQALTATPLADIKDLATRYGTLLNMIDGKWQALLAETQAAGQPVPARLPIDAEEEIRQSLYTADAPTNIAVAGIGDIEFLPDRASQGTLRELRKAIEDFRSAGPVAPPRAMTLEDTPVPFAAYVFKRGNPNNRGEAVSRRFLSVLSNDPAQPVAFPNGSGRLELAQGIASRDNPLTARVLVNRIWAQHFGRGLVATPSDFGTRSDPPSHPALLDYLAWTFMEQGWSIKQLQREIVLSATFRQASHDRPEGVAADPENRWLWRMNRRRLDFEGQRDSLLLATGNWDKTVGGPSINLLAHPGPRRRTIYGSIDRLALPGLLRTFDFPSPDTSSPQRDSTTVPAQALYYLNHPFVLDTAKQVLQRSELVAAEVATDEKIQRLYRATLARNPTPDELTASVQFLGADDPLKTTIPENDWEQLAQALLLLNEFIFVD